MPSSLSHYDLYSPHQFPWWCINIFAILWLASLLIDKMLTKLIHTYSTLSHAKQRNVVTYIVLLVGTTYALVAQVYGGMDILFRGENYTSLERFEWMMLSLTTIATLFLAFHATTEQASFVALAAYRLNLWPQFHPIFLYFAAFQTLVTKTVVMVYTFVPYSMHLKSGYGDDSAHPWEVF